MRQIENPSFVVELVPKARHISHEEIPEGSASKCHVARQVRDVPPMKKQVTDHRVNSLRRECGKIAKDEFL